METKYTKQIALILENARGYIKEFIYNHNGEYINQKNELPFITYFEPEIDKNMCAEIHRIYTETTLFGIIDIFVELSNGVIRHISNCELWEICYLADTLKHIAKIEQEGK